MCHTHTHESDSEVNNHINTHWCKCLNDIRQKERRTVSSLLYERKQHSLCAISPVTLTRLCAITLHLNVSRQPRNICMSPFFIYLYVMGCQEMSPIITYTKRRLHITYTYHCIAGFCHKHIIRTQLALWTCYTDYHILYVNVKWFY